MELNIAATTLPGVAAGALSCVFAVVQYYRVQAKPVGKDIDCPLLDTLAGQIKSGSKAFLKEEYKYLSVFVLFLALALFACFTAQNDAADGGRTVLAFLVGAFLSGLAGWLGMSVATDGNVRTTVACTAGTLNDGLKVAFTTGTVMGFMVVGLGLGGVSIVFALLTQMADTLDDVLRNLSAFGFGASSIALFARVAGGIYTKAADVGADLVGKVEAGIDEDDAHNPAVIADNVGDNVGDVAGMGADLFESYVGSLIAAMSIAAYDGMLEFRDEKMMLPIWLSAAGIVCSMIGVFFVSTNEKGAGWNSNLSALMVALEKGMWVAGILFIVAAFVICYQTFPEDVSVLGLDGEQISGTRYRIFGCILLGLVVGMAIGKATEYFTSFDFGPTISIKDRGITGPATVVIQGIGVGMISCTPTTILLVVCILACAALDGAYGVAISAVGMLATLGITLATDAYGPVADNAGGLAEMDPAVPKEVRGKTDALDALGNTTAATGKGFAIGSAVLTSLSLVQAFKQRVMVVGSPMDFAVDDPIVLSGVLLGAMMPMLFAALTMISVGKAAAEIIIEVRTQFHGNENGEGAVPGLYACIQKASQDIPIPPEEEVLPNSDRCVAISTRSSVREMIAPGLYAILIPLMVGFTVGPRCLMGMLAGAIASGCMNAIMMSNAGGAWDNSKKLCEKLQLKKTDQGKACVVGDTVGDPFKDTSGPSLNILIKLMSMVSLTLSPLLQGNQDWENWYYGMAPTGIFLVATGILLYMDILGWSDPLAGLVAKTATSPRSAAKITEKSPLAAHLSASGSEDDERATAAQTPPDAKDAQKYGEVLGL
jgi:inorganic pyrophosphatase